VNGPRTGFFCRADDDRVEATMSPTSHDYAFDDWPVQGRDDTDVTFVGRTDAEGSAEHRYALHGGVFYDGETHTLFSGDVNEDDERIVPVPDAEVDLEPGETLGEALERVGEQTGWDSLSEFARDHLEDDEEA
jgi:hypothetical protein